MEPPKDVEVFESPMSIIWFDGNGILCSVYKEKAQLTKEGLEVTFGFIKSRAKGKKICWLGDVTNLSSTDKETRDFSAAETPAFIKALALVTNSPLSKMIANIFLTLKKPPYPTKVFNNEIEAKEWLNLYV